MLKTVWCIFYGIEQEEEEEEDEILFQEYHILPSFHHDVQNSLNIQYSN